MRKIWKVAVRSPANLTKSPNALAAIALTIAVSASPGHAQAPPLGTTADFAVLGGAAVTNTGPTVLDGTAAHPGDLGVSPGSSITGFFVVDGGPGTLAGPGAAVHAGDAAAIQAQIDLTTAYADLAGRPATGNLTGQNLGGLTLVPGVYNFSTAAQLTGNLTLNGLGNPNAVFIFNIGSTLTTASASMVSLINAAQGGNVFWRVGSSATLGTSTSFTGDILAQASITLNTTADITCGAAWARTGSVTLDTNTISICDLIVGPGGGGPVIGPTGAPLFTSFLPPSATSEQREIAAALDAYTAGGGMLSLAFLNLFNLPPDAFANALSELSGEAATGVPQAGTQAMNSFLTLLTNPFADNRDIAPESVPPPPRRPAYYKGPLPVAAAAIEPRRWSVWGAAYGGQSNTQGDTLAGTHDRSARVFGFATGIDYRIVPSTTVGFALAGGGTNFGLSGGLGGGHSDMVQAGVYSITRFNAAYVSTAIAYAWHDETTHRLIGLDGERLDANFDANNVGGRIEAGYRFAIPSIYSLWGFGVTPYGALQAQAFRTPSYRETAATGVADFALAYAAHTTTTTRSELGVWLDWPVAFDNGTILALRTRTAWAHDEWSGQRITAGFVSLPGSSFTVVGALPPRDSLLASASAEISFKNGISLAGTFDGEFTGRSQTYTGSAQLRYTW